MMDEADAVVEKPESTTICEDSAAAEADLEKKTEELADEKGVNDVGNSKLGETDDMQVDESQVEDFKDDGTEKSREIEDSMEIEKVVSEEANQENKEILEKEEAVEKTDASLEGVADAAQEGTDDRKNIDEVVHQDGDDKESGHEQGTGSMKQCDDDGGVETHEVGDDKESSEEPVKKKGSKKQSHSKSSVPKKTSHPPEHTEEENEKEHRTPREKKKRVQLAVEEIKTPTAYSADRPVRERKSVERLVASVEKDSEKEFHVEKGRGTALKDIPNVAYKLSRKKTEETFKLLYTILFGRRGKAAQIRTNISRFSGFVWHDNDEKQMAKVKEKFDKCVKEKLVEFCDVLDIPISKVNTRKEDLINKLVEFLLEPRAMTSELIADKEQSSKGKKRKRSSNPATESHSASKSSSKNQNKKSSSKTSGEGKSRQAASDDESEGEEDEASDRDGTNGVLELSENEMHEEAEGDDKENDSMESQKKKTKKNSSASKEKSAQKTDKKERDGRQESQPPPKKTPAKFQSSQLKKSQEATPKASSGKKKGTPIKKPSTPKQPTKEESTGKKVLKAKDKIEGKLKPTDDELKNAVCKILKEVDFNKATFTDILVMLAKQFDTDLTSRKAGIKLMIQDELTKLAGADDDEEEEEEGGDLEKKEPSTKDVKV